MAEPANLPELEETRGWVGFKLDEMDGSTVGRVEGVFVDAISREPTWLVIRIGRLGHRSAVPYQVVAGGVGRVWVPYERAVIRGAPEVDPAVGLDPAREQALFEHFGIPAQDRRRAELEQRAGEAFSSVPATRV